jgi:hypothetical protein
MNFNKISSCISKKNNITLSETKNLISIKQKIIPLIKQSNILSHKYEIVITNPPYMGKKSLNKKLSKYMDSNYKYGKTELYSSFIIKCYDLAKENGIISMVTIHTWMFIKSFEKLRDFLNKNGTIISMNHTGAATFDDVRSFNVLATSFQISKKKINNFQSTFLKLGEYDKIEKKKRFHDMTNRFIISQNSFSMIPGMPIAYWVSKDIINAFKNGKSLSSISDIKVGLQTADNKCFLRLWHEVDFNKIGFELKNLTDAKNSNKKWFPYNKGGKFRKWYGNNEYVLNYENDGYELKNFNSSVLRNVTFYFKEGLTWSLFGFNNFGVRYKNYGFIFDVSGSSMFPEKETMYYILAFLSSKIAFLFLSILAPTVNFQIGNIGDLPLIKNENKKEEIETCAKENIKLSKSDWDNFETSWGFKKHPLLNHVSHDKLIYSSYLKWEAESEKRYNLLKKNEESINKYFIDIYGLYNELTPDVSNTDITLKKANISREVVSLISYFVGNMLGRFSLDKDGLIYSGGEWESSEYQKFIPDEDNIVPILDTEYFEDDIVNRFIEFLKISFNEETLEENLAFIATNLNTKGKTNREIIRNYFLNNFYKNHVRMYKKTPIYWLFSSGKNNAFKALIYMHRYSSDLVARVRTDYLHKTQKAIEIAIESRENIIQNSSNNKEISKANKEKNKLLKQLEEIREYDEALSHIANQQIEIDLDNGVKVNYDKFQSVEIVTGSGKVKKINLLEKI